MCAVPGNCFSFSQELLLLVIPLSPSLSRPSQLSSKTHLAMFFSKIILTFQFQNFIFLYVFNLFLLDKQIEKRLIAATVFLLLYVTRPRFCIRYFVLTPFFSYEHTKNFSATYTMLDFALIGLFKFDDK